MKNLSFADAIVVGLGQSLAVVPGVSRAGIVMLTMMIKGYNRKEAAVYSFLLAVPTILAAAALDLIKVDFKILLDPNNLLLVAVGFVTSFVTAYISVKWLINFLKKETLTGFGIYRILISAILWFTR